MDLVFATNNSSKLSEVQKMLTKKGFKLLSLSDIGCEEDIPETGQTLQDNALIKASYIKEKFGYDCFADDTGLEVGALNGAPGVYSARYAGTQRNADDNMQKLLNELKDKNDRKAQFRTVICLMINDETHYFEGSVQGSIAEKHSGNEGFGYDPVFIPEGENRSFAEMSTDEKNGISHRGRAIKKLVEYLNSHTKITLS